MKNIINAPYQLRDGGAEAPNLNGAFGFRVVVVIIVDEGCDGKVLVVSLTLSVTISVSLSDVLVISFCVMITYSVVLEVVLVSSILFVGLYSKVSEGVIVGI